MTYIANFKVGLTYFEVMVMLLMGGGGKGGGGDSYKSTNSKILKFPK